VDARLKLAECLILLGKMDEALAEYETVTIVDPYRQEGYLGQADVAVRRGEEAAALAAFDAGAAAIPYSAEVREQWGYYLVARGMRAEGYGRLKEALALDASKFRLRQYLTRAGVIPVDDVDRALAFDAVGALAEPVSPEDYPHADTVMLWDQSGTYLDDDFTFREQNRNLIHLFNDKGRERWGEITILSESGTELLAARTHLPAGGAVDAVSVKESGGYKVVSMEQVIPGATLEIAYDLNLGRRMIYNLAEYYSQPFFMAEEEEALGRTRFALVTNDGFPGADRLRFDAANGAPRPRKVRGDGRTAWIFERQDVPAVVAEPMMPSKDGYAPYVRATTFADVDTLARWYQGELWGVFRADDVLKTLAPARTPGEDDRALAARVYYYVVKNVEGTGGSVFYPTAARLTAFRGRGRTVDRAVLIVALCRVLGIDAKVALVGAGGTKREWGLITPDIFDTVLVYFPTLGTGGTYADPLLDTLAFGEVWTSTYGKPALVVDDAGYQIKRVPVVPFEKDAIALDMDLTLAADGSAEFEGRRAYRGLRGAYRDNFRNPEDRDGNVEITLAALFAGATVYAYDLENLVDLEGEFALAFQGTVPGYARGRGENLALKAVPYQLNLAQTYITSEKRRYPLRIERPESWIDEVRITLPARWRPDVKSGTVRFHGPASQYSLTYEVTDEKLTIKRALFVDQGDIAPRDYAAFVKFCREVDAVEKRELTLAPTGDGR
jgi:tetratricopeptide (TPR) repeat protein